MRNSKTQDQNVKSIKKNAESKDPTVSKTSNGKIMLFLKCLKCNIYQRTRVRRTAEPIRNQNYFEKNTSIG